MTNEQIDRLVAARNKITDVCLPDGVYVDTSDIDAVLRDVPQGQRPDVDALLGRTYQAERDRIAQQSVTLDTLADDIIAEMERDTAKLIETTRRIWRETEPIEY
jgi:hypothetical protein